MEAEEIESFLAEYKRPYDLSVTSRNLVTRGVRLNELVGREFHVGEVKLRGVERCEPCLDFGAALASPDLKAADVVKHFVHRAGLRAEVLTSGTITRGAKVASATPDGKVGAVQCSADAGTFVGSLPLECLIAMSPLAPLPETPPGPYRHYKGGEYEVLGVARHSETLEPLVVYRPLYNASGLWVRPHHMFFEEVEVAGKRQPRFSRIK